MSSAIFTTAYFPPISYFVALLSYDKIYIEAYENYQKQSFRNRAYIAGPNGKQSLNIPVIKTTGNHTNIKSIELDTQSNWKQQHWNSIATAYNSSPFLMYYVDEIKAVFFNEHNTLWKLNWDLLMLMLELFQIDNKIAETSSFELKYDESIDYRFLIHPKKESLLESQYINNEYYQVFKDKNGFIKDLSCLDLLFNMGPESGAYLRSFRL
jgi:hypothetical protein